MRAVCWYGKNDVRVKNVPEPRILNRRDAIIKVSSTAICGSDLHLYNGVIPTMKEGDILGHEFMGEVVELGPGVQNLQLGDRVVVPFDIACGGCHNCAHGFHSLCDNSNPNAVIADTAYGHSGAGLFGYSHMMGGYAGGQAEYVRVPYADVGPLKIPEHVPDEKVLFLSDSLPTAFMAVDQSGVKSGDTLAVWGCGPVGLLAMECARLIGVERIIAIDSIPFRLELARDRIGAVVLDYTHSDILEALDELTAGRGPDVCIDAVGLEAEGHGIGAMYDRLKHYLLMASDRPTALRQMIQACKKGGTVSIPGVYGGVADKFPIGAAFSKGLTLVGGQTHVQRYMRPLLEHILERDVDASFVITHRLPLEAAPEAYKTFNEERNECVKVVLKPN